MKALKFSSLALAGLLISTTAYVGDADAARKRMSAKPAASAPAKPSSRYGSSNIQAQPAAPARSAAPAASAAPARTNAAPATAGTPAPQAAPQSAGSGFMGSMAGAVAGSVIGGAVVNTLFADDAVAEEAPATTPEQAEAVAQ